MVLSNSCCISVHEFYAPSESGCSGRVENAYQASGPTIITSRRAPHLHFLKFMMLQVSVPVLSLKMCFTLPRSSFSSLDLTCQGRRTATTVFVYDFQRRSTAAPIPPNIHGASLNIRWTKKLHPLSGAGGVESDGGGDDPILGKLEAGWQRTSFRNI